MDIVPYGMMKHEVSNNDVMVEQDDAVEEKVTALLPSSVLTGLADANWKERLSAMEKMTDVRLLN